MFKYILIFHNLFLLLRSFFCGFVVFRLHNIRSLWSSGLRSFSFITYSICGFHLIGGRFRALFFFDSQFSIVLGHLSVCILFTCTYHFSYKFCRYIIMEDVISRHILSVLYLFSPVIYKHLLKKSSYKNSGIDYFSPSIYYYTILFIAELFTPTYAMGLLHSIWKLFTLEAFSICLHFVLREPSYQPYAIILLPYPGLEPAIVLLNYSLHSTTLYAVISYSNIL